MEQSTFNPGKPLLSFQALPATLLQKLQEANIHTIGQLLGATKGLSANLEFFSEPEELEAIDRIKEQIPEATLKEYKDFYFRPPLGLIKNKKEEGHNNEKSR